LPNMAKRNHHLAETDRHIAQTKSNIARQRALIEHRARVGHPVNLAVALLHTLEDALETFEGHRALILKQRRVQPRPRSPRA